MKTDNLNKIRWFFILLFQSLGAFRLQMVTIPKLRLLETHVDKSNNLIKIAAVDHLKFLNIIPFTQLIVSKQYTLHIPSQFRPILPTAHFPFNFCQTAIHLSDNNISLTSSISNFHHHIFFIFTLSIQGYKLDIENITAVHSIKIK